MDEKLGILVDKALYDAGLINKEEFTKRVNVYLEVDEVDDSDIDTKTTEVFKEGNGEKQSVEKEIKIDIVEDKSDKLELDKLIENTDPIKKNVIVEYFADHSEVDDYTPNQKKALVEFIANTDNLDEYTPEEKQAIVEYLTDSGDPDNWTPEQKEAVAKFIKDSIEPDSYQPPNPTGVVTFNKDTSNIDTYDPPNFTRYVTYYAKKAFTTGAAAGKKKLSERFGIVNGTANSDGSAFINGTGKAFKQGDWRTKRSETALTGEIGREIVVTPNNRWYTVGDNGAEFVNIPKGSIVFNHKQTEELLRNGKVTSDGGRAKSLVNGSAYLGGTAHRGYGEWIEPEVKSFKVGYDYGDTDKNQDIFDWVKVAIERAKRAIENFGKTANNVYKSWSERNTALNNEIIAVGNEIEIQNNAITAYKNVLSEIKIPQEYITAIKNGSIDIDNISDEELASKIKDYQKWYEEILKCEDSIVDLNKTQSELAAQKFDNVIAQYDGILEGFDHTKTMLDEYISQAEKKGRIVSKKYYQALINNEKQNSNGTNFIHSSDFAFLKVIFPLKDI